MSGGGTGGHILPNIALIHELRARAEKRHLNLEILYIGTRHGMERGLMKELQVQYQGIFAGKLRRYFSLENFLDFFKIPVGLLQALWTLIRFRPQVIFCKGGYVCLPVAFAGRILGIPVILHESDVSPGLANRLSARFASTICLAHQESEKYFSKKKKGLRIIVTGNPVRRELAFGNANTGLKLAGFEVKKPVLLVMGGSLGADFINKLIWRNLEELLQKFQILHICGKGKTVEAENILSALPKGISGYRSFEFVGPELKHFYAAATVILARSGALTLAEIGFFNKPVLLIPLPKNASRGDQIENAEIYAKKHLSTVMDQEKISKKNQIFLDALYDLLKKASRNLRIGNNNTDIADLAEKFAPLEKIANLLETACR